MRILIHTQFYPPEMGAPQARLSDLAGRLKAMGHDVRVVTAIPNYPTGRTFAGYPRAYAREDLNGIPVFRAWILPSASRGLLHRLVSYSSFALSSLVVGALAGGAAEVVITESPPLFLGVSGWLLAVTKGARWVLNVSDLWPESAKFIGIMRERGLAYRVLRALAHGLYRKAWLVTGQSKEIVEEIARQAPKARVYHLSNGTDTRAFGPENFSQEVRRKYLRDEETGFVYAGLHGLFQGLDQVVMAAQTLKEEPIRFVFFGEGPEKKSLQRQARELGLCNIDFHPPLPHADMPEILASMDVALVCLRSPILGAVPSKIYEAMASGIPVLVVAEGEAARVVTESGGGVAVRPGDVEGLAASVRRLASEAHTRLQMGRAGRLAVVAHFDRDTIVREFEAVLTGAT